MNKEIVMSDYCVELAKLCNNIKIGDYIKSGISTAYHYTSPNGFFPMIQNSSLRFTDRFYLNDKSEGIYVLQLCINNINYFEKIDDKFRNKFEEALQKRLNVPQRDRFFVYQCSLSSDADSLCMWNYYSKNDGIKGYNIGLDVNKAEKYIKPQLLDNNRKPQLRCGEVIYEEEKQLKLIEKLVMEFYEFSESYTQNYYDFTCAYLVDKIMFLGIFFKAKFFEIEKEFRLAFDLYLNEDGKYAVIKNEQKFYEKNGIFIPCIDIKFDTEMLTRIGISPTLNFNAAKDSVLRLVGDKYPKINDNSIFESKIPIRY